MDSIIQREKYCYFCLTKDNLHKHHIYMGANRKVSEKYGFVCYLCGYHHNLGGQNCVHENREMDLLLKKQCQKEFEENHSREEFVKLIGRNYL